MKPFTLTPNLDGSDLHIGIVCARFNEELTFAELEACLDELKELGVEESNVMVVTVAGALELGLALQTMATTQEFDALIAIGAVIRGETYHFEIVSNESAAAITRVGLDMNIPIANGVLTCDTEEQAAERVDEKGRDCAHVAVEMANTLLDLVPEFDEEDFLEDEEESEEEEQ
ncbi:6,7-dimethyl-8-ribityllumazine synthase [Basilea psittacipulmonis]|uniref:6,7-dimethyl-8-ribityllumazine synthase n=1 Tax=Basilea psittacipulmonis DSM 24701 TaxID=1072685 RepID=A0A077DE93_9BURK|nr:6,7-dimethyl-8-ribityllumazine synthase [Basilea psittacipulmonis]AIL32486.1 6,7-dimethyl-8-ribityllumazine synthase [Basilea psittacipulmonis DSM 24701]